MLFWKHLNIWVLIYSFNVSLLLTGIAIQLMPFIKHILISTTGNVTFFGVGVFILFNVIAYGAFHVFMYADMVRPWFLE